MQHTAIILWLLFIIFTPVQATNHLKIQVSNAHAEGNKVSKTDQLILEKIEASYANLADIDALEEAGMDKKHIHQLRHAFTLKLQELENTLKNKD